MQGAVGYFFIYTFNCKFAKESFSEEISYVYVAPLLSPTLYLFAGSTASHTAIA